MSWNTSFVWSTTTVRLRSTVESVGEMLTVVSSAIVPSDRVSRTLAWLTGTIPATELENDGAIAKYAGIADGPVESSRQERAPTVAPTRATDNSRRFERWIRTFASYSA